MKLLYTTCLTVLSVLFCQASLFGQPERGKYDFEFIRSGNPWLTSDNASGLGTMRADRTSVAEAYFFKGNGALTGLDGSDDNFSAGARTESYMKISDRIAFYGKMGYSYELGKNMGGQMFMDPSYNPVNFLEYTDTTVGNKSKELYDVVGGIAYSFNGKWAIGGRFDYQAGTSAKRKDPRTQSDWMDLGVSAGGRFAPSDVFSVGLNFKYRKTMEKLQGRIYGTTDKQYYTFVDYGGFYGIRETFGETHLDTDPIPMLNSFYGGSIQLDFGRRTKFFNEFTFLLRSGYYGKRSYGSVVYFENDGYLGSYRGELLIPARDNLHKISLNADFESMKNNENIYRKTTNPGESSVVEYFGQNEVLDRTDIGGSLSYTGYMDVDDFRPSWEYGLELCGHYRSSTATIYPYYRQQTVMNFTASVFGKKNIVSGRNIFTAGLSGGYFMGFGTPKSDGVLATSSSEAPKSADDYLNRDFEYKTAARAEGILNFRYTRLFDKGFAVYIDLRDSFTHLVQKPEFLKESYRNEFLVSVGFAF